MLSGDKLYDKPPKKRNRPEENPYTGLGAVSNIPVVFYKAFGMPEVNNDPIGVENGAYSNDCNSSIYEELDEMAMEPSGLPAVCLHVCLTSPVSNPAGAWDCDPNPVSDYVCCLLYTSPSPRDRHASRMPSSA